MADASHELRTPVAIMRSETEVALSQQERSNEDLRDSLAIVKDETRRLTRIVEDLFTLARADAGQYKFTLKGFYLNELAGEEAEDRAEGAESERLKSLARITPEQARDAALAQVPGTAKKVELENEDGNVVYGVEIKTARGESDVKVDAGDGRVLHVEHDGEGD
jgi:uncharacterized membrane protein YkoI